MERKWYASNSLTRLFPPLLYPKHAARYPATCPYFGFLPPLPELSLVCMVADVIQVQPGNVEVSSIASRVSNGEVVSNFPSPLSPEYISVWDARLVEIAC